MLAVASLFVLYISEYIVYFFLGVHHEKIILTLPFPPEDEAIGIIPAGEQLYHQFYLGHPGIDFTWEKKTPVFASSDGIIKRISYGSSVEGQWDVAYHSGDYMLTYKELSDYNRNLTEGMKISTGDLIGYTNCQKFDENITNCMVHWEFADILSDRYPWLERLCPLTYLDESSKVRIEKIWNSTSWDMKIFYPDICSDGYKGRDTLEDAKRIDAQHELWEYNQTKIENYFKQFENKRESQESVSKIKT